MAGYQHNYLLLVKLSLSRTWMSAHVSFRFNACYDIHTDKHRHFHTVHKQKSTHTKRTCYKRKNNLLLINWKWDKMHFRSPVSVIAFNEKALELLAACSLSTALHQTQQEQICRLHYNPSIHWPHQSPAVSSSQGFLHSKWWLFWISWRHCGKSLN